MNIILKRNVPLHCFDILIEMGVQTDKRPDIVAITKRALELGGTISAAAICEDLIHRPDALAAGQNILLRCQELKLVDGNGSLTEEGRRTAEEKTVFIPERGTYRAWFTTDPLLPQTLVFIRPINDGGVKEEIYSNGKGKDRSGGLMELPAWIQDAVDDEIWMLGDGKTIKIYSMQDVARRVDKHGFSLQLTLSIPQFGMPSLTAMSSTWEEVLNIENLPFQIEFEYIWLSLLGVHEHDWTGSHLRSPYDLLSDAERTRFRTDISIQKPTLDLIGSFDDTIVQEVPIAPKTLHDAEQWSRFLLSHRINAYLHPDEYERITQEILLHEEFGYFAASLSFPAQEALSAEFAGTGDTKPKEYWYLQAPLDLRPMEVVHE